MKKRILLLICATLCLFLVLCSCSDEEKNGNSQGNTNTSSGTQGSNTNSSSTNDSTTQSPTTNSSTHDHDHDHDNSIVTPPETKCPISDKGHYWRDVAINKNTDASGSIILTGKCHLCGENVSKQAVSLVTYEEWKKALSKEGLSSFTTLIGNEYSDYDQNGKCTWRIENDTYSVDYFINSADNNNSEIITNFMGFSLQYEDFKYDKQSKTYVYWMDENSYVELGFADGYLLSHTVVSRNGDKESRATTLYLNHGRVDVSVPSELTDKYSQSITLDSLKKSNISDSLAEKIFGELKEATFDLPFELSLLENDQLSVYFTLFRPRKDPVLGQDYSSLSVIVDEGKVTSVSFGTVSVELS